MIYLKYQAEAVILGKVRAIVLIDQTERGGLAQAFLSGIDVFFGGCIIEWSGSVVGWSRRVVRKGWS